MRINWSFKTKMVHFCSVPGCSNRSDRETTRSYFRLPLKRRKLLKIWVHKIRRKNLPINCSTRICSDHFVSAAGRLLRPDEYPSVNLPVLSTTTSQAKARKPPSMRVVQPADTSPNTTDEETSEEVPMQMTDAGVQVSDESKSVIAELSKKVLSLEEQLCASKFRLENICEDNNKVLFYTGFPNYTTLKVCFDYLGLVSRSQTTFFSFIFGREKRSGECPI